MVSRKYRRLWALIKKETLQVRRDPSCILTAFVLPMILLFIFGFGLSLDAKYVKLGFVSEEYSPVVGSLRRSFQVTEFIELIYYASRKEAEEALINGRIRGIVILQNGFTKRLHTSEFDTIQLITDGVETNTASILTNYVVGIITRWMMQQNQDYGMVSSTIPIEIKTRVLFNTELKSRNALIPGSVVMIMSIIGTLLTSLVVAREWERGTMEAMLAAPIGSSDMIFGKLIPYYFLGILSTGISILVSVFLFQVPFRGTVGALFLISTAFLLASLAMGFLISTVTRNQFLASMGAFMFAFLPNVMLSGAIFEIDAMPFWIRVLTYIFPSRYYVTSLRTIFMTGDIWELFIPNLVIMSFIAAILFIVVLILTPKRLR
ncbi:MAG: ABC transporter permease [Planctomycetaceae bacterium]|jgi:ABC-2 type transport system permease protein|nr:ABC transporter permease [Planctomycetaceae bacterium]